jgi:hypothetical protein
VPELPELARTGEHPVATLAVAGAAEGRARVEVRCWLNAPATVGAVLREDSGGAAMLVP